MPAARAKGGSKVRKKAAGRIRSMTGFGRGAGARDGVRAAVEIRSVNQRHLRISVKLPPQLSVLDPRVRELVLGGSPGGGPRRGQIDAFVSVEDGAAGGVPLPDIRHVRRYVDAWRKIARDLKIPGELRVGVLAAMPQFFAVESEHAAGEGAWLAVEKAVRGALKALDRMRAVEGARMGRELGARIKRLEAAAKRIKRRSKTLTSEHAAKLRARTRDLLAGIGLPKDALDPGALEREVALRGCIVADRADVSEELERIASHTDQFHETLAAGSPAGRKLEFIVQEIHREINTLGAKVSDTEAGREVVEFKSELERVREQVQNVE